jgi:hypothetical protein
MTDRWRDSPTPENRCPYCGQKNDRVSDPKGGGPPHRGDRSICIWCGGVAIFTRSLRVRKPSPRELAAAMADPAVRTMQAIVEALEANK